MTRRESSSAVEGNGPGNGVSTILPTSRPNQRMKRLFERAGDKRCLGCGRNVLKASNGCTLLLHEPGCRNGTKNVIVEAVPELGHFINREREKRQRGEGQLELAEFIALADTVECLLSGAERVVLRGDKTGLEWLGFGLALCKVYAEILTLELAGKILSCNITSIETIIRVHLRHSSQVVDPILSACAQAFNMMRRAPSSQEAAA